MSDEKENVSLEIVYLSLWNLLDADDKLRILIQSGDLGWGGWLPDKAI